MKGRQAAIIRDFALNPIPTQNKVIERLNRRERVVSIEGQPAGRYG
jgi:hypothetical protein